MGIHPESEPKLVVNLNDGNILGTARRIVAGDVYEGTFVGDGFVDSSPEASCLADITYEEHCSLVISGFDLNEQVMLSMGDLFPETWMGERVIYEINVKARRVAPEEPQI